MKFAKTIVYVEDAKASLEFFEKAFGLKTRAFYDQGVGEVETGGDTTIAFANYGIGQGHLPERYTAGRCDQVGFELSLVSENVEADFKRAVEAGAESLQEPEKKPWGQVSSYLRLPDGTFVDLASPVAY
jgi:uncharacterized glyoxalase superfamily protein PhnB